MFLSEQQVRDLRSEQMTYIRCGHPVSRLERIVHLARSVEIFESTNMNISLLEILSGWDQTSDRVETIKEVKAVGDWLWLSNRFKSDSISHRDNSLLPPPALVTPPVTCPTKSERTNSGINSWDSVNLIRLWCWYDMIVHVNSLKGWCW